VAEGGTQLRVAYSTPGDLLIPLATLLDPHARIRDSVGRTAYGLCRRLHAVATQPPGECPAVLPAPRPPGSDEACIPRRPSADVFAERLCLGPRAFSHRVSDGRSFWSLNALTHSPPYLISWIGAAGWPQQWSRRGQGRRALAPRSTTLGHCFCFAGIALGCWRSPERLSHPGVVPHLPARGSLQRLSESPGLGVSWHSLKSGARVRRSLPAAGAQEGPAWTPGPWRCSSKTARWAAR